MIVEVGGTEQFMKDYKYPNTQFEVDFLWRVIEYLGSNDRQAGDQLIGKQFLKVKELAIGFLFEGFIGPDGSDFIAVWIHRSGRGNLVAEGNSMWSQKSLYFLDYLFDHSNIWVLWKSHFLRILPLLATHILLKKSDIYY